MCLQGVLVNDRGRGEIGITAVSKTAFSGSTHDDPALKYEINFNNSWNSGRFGIFYFLALFFYPTQRLFFATCLFKLFI